MDGFAENIRLWPRLMYAATQGQLSRLETLPRPEVPSLKSYINAALTFKNSLTSLWVTGDELNSQSQFVDSATYGTIFNQIDQFKNLKTLYFECYTSKYLSHFDELIDKCHSLKTLSFDLDIIGTVYPSNEYIQTILPRPYIQTLECCWGQINAKRKLEYLMHKFPNLQRLKVGERYFGAGYSCPTLEKFIQYTLSVPDFELEIEVRINGVPNVWSEFAKTKNGCKNLTLNYLHDDPSFTLHQLELSAKLGLHLLFLEDDELPHIQFLSKGGKSLRSVRIADGSLFQCMNDEASTMAWLFDILRLCPLLEEIAIGNPPCSSPIHHTLQYPSLKKLIIDEFSNIKSIDFLNCLSFSLPSLCQFSLSFNDKNMDPIVINMPHTSFNLLVWNEESYNVRFFKGSEFYIKLNTDKGLEYYLGERNMLPPISQSRYLLSPKNVRFDISCKHLKELRIGRALPESDSSFVF